MNDQIFKVNDNLSGTGGWTSNPDQLGFGKITHDELEQLIKDGIVEKGGFNGAYYRRR